MPNRHEGNLKNNLPCPIKCAAECQTGLTLKTAKLVLNCVPPPTHTHTHTTNTNIGPRPLKPQENIGSNLTVPQDQGGLPLPEKDFLDLTKRYAGRTQSAFAFSYRGLGSGLPVIVQEDHRERHAGNLKNNLPCPIMPSQPRSKRSGRKR